MGAGRQERRTLLAAGAPPPIWAAQGSYTGVSRSEGCTVAGVSSLSGRAGERWRRHSPTLLAAGAPLPSTHASHAGVRCVSGLNSLSGGRKGWQIFGEGSRFTRSLSPPTLMLSCSTPLPSLPLQPRIIPTLLPHHPHTGSPPCRPRRSRRCCPGSRPWSRRSHQPSHKRGNGVGRSVGNSVRMRAGTPLLKGHVNACAPQRFTSNPWTRD